MGKFNRRNFLKSSLIGAGGALIAKPAISSTTPTGGNEKVITRTLGKTGLQLPVLSMGVMRADNPRLVTAAMDSGIVFFDTAYGYQKGKNEEMLGDVFKDYPRDKIIIQTKVLPGDRNRETDSYGPGATKESFLEMFETSLGRLQTDYVDILLHHVASSRAGVLHEPTITALQQAKKDGKTRFIGVSTHKNEPEVIRAAIETGVIDVITVAYNFKQDHRAEIGSAIADAAKAGIGIIGMKNMAGGFLDEEKQKPVNGKAALKWALRDPHVTTCIPGFTTFDELEQDIEIMTDLELTIEEMKELELAGEEMGLYCQGCTQCLSGCRKGLPIPEIMRSYMYAYGYGEMQKARDTLDEYRVQSDPCKGCTECSVSCAKGFPVADRVKNVSRLIDVPEDFIV
ncbi:MAG TPA: oxidoreductase [Bacteroides sp.]|nr:oxidoreductase [Bacteroides sp.]